MTCEEMDSYFENFIEQTADELIMELRESRKKSFILNSKKEIVYV
jgi:hypothetical protein